MSATSSMQYLQIAWCWEDIVAVLRGAVLRVEVGVRPAPRDVVACRIAPAPTVARAPEKG